jgi:rubrerythrin
MKRSFAVLDAQEALHAAVFIEERNAEVYHRFAEMFVEFGDAESLEIAGVFWEMAIEEHRHSSLLRSCYADQYGAATCQLTEEELLEFIEVPRLEDADLPAAGGDGTQGARERALQVALRAEISAQQYYAKLSESTAEVSLRRLYQQLAAMEDGHVAYLEEKLAREGAEQPPVN